MASLNRLRFILFVLCSLLYVSAAPTSLTPRANGNEIIASESLKVVQRSRQGDTTPLHKRLDAPHNPPSPAETASPAETPPTETPHTREELEAELLTSQKQLQNRYKLLEAIPDTEPAEDADGYAWDLHEEETDILGEDISALSEKIAGLKGELDALTRSGQ